jgi:curved DNA-binding protein CbpA
MGENMPNYYKILHIEPSASRHEIEAAIDEQYQKWNQLVTHHEPEVALKAGQGKQLLQRIRETLLNKEKRKAYDEGLGLGDTIGSLLDPDAIMQAMSTPMGVPHSGNKVSSQEEAMRERTDAWICPKCSKANPIGTIYCENCATRLSANCPSCGSLSELNKKFCPKCGSDKKEVFNNQKEALIANLQKERKQLQKNKDHIEHEFFNSKSRVVEKGVVKEHKQFIIFWLVATLGFFLWLGISYFTIAFGLFFLIMLIISIFSVNSKYKREYSVLLTEISQELKKVNNKISTISSFTYKKDHDKLDSSKKTSKS